MKTGHTPSRSEPEYWEQCDIPWFTLADVWQLRDERTKYLAETKERISFLGLKNSAAELLPAGTVVFSRTASVGFSGIMPIPMATTQDFWNWIPGRKLTSEYLLYVFRSMRQEFDRLTMGSTHKTIYQPDAARLSICVPPLAEQRTIADFLDRETAKLDTLVAKKRALIEKLKEKRTALISRTVTRGMPTCAAASAGMPAEAAAKAGLHPQPKLKPSGIEWLGDVPEHWEVKPLGYLVRFRGGATPDKGKPEYWDGDIPWVSPKDMKRPRIADAEDHVSIEGLRNSPLSMVPVGAVLIVVRGMILAHSFPVALTEGPVTINQDMKALVCSERLGAEFLFWALCGLSRAVVSLAEESAHGTRKLETATLARFRIPVPPSPEQRVIADYLDRETAKIDRLVAKVEEAIERLQEYRSALITAAVTGKIDVRDAGHAAGDVVGDSDTLRA